MIQVPGILERFLRYVRVDTHADETSSSCPSTTIQLELSRMLKEECISLGLNEVNMSEHGIVMATIPATTSHHSPVIAWVAHVDTSPEYNSDHVTPIVHENYDGQDIMLPEGDNLVISVGKNPKLSQLIGETIVTTDGSTLLGADDKSGIACIMATAEYLIAHQEIPHGTIRLCFTVDEEIGRGTENLNLEQLNAHVAYTLDSSGEGRIDGETFSANQAIVTVTGVNTHPSEGKDKLVNAIRILSAFLDRLPQKTLSPETTSGREGFIHPYVIEGGVAEACAKLILRDFETKQLDVQEELLKSIASSLMAEYPDAIIQIEVKKQYRNMRDGLRKEPRALEKAIQATMAAGLEPDLQIIRGGTDGSLLTELGLPTPNLSSGQHNPHSPLEWTSVKEMNSACNVLIELAQLWGEERV